MNEADDFSTYHEDLLDGHYDCVDRIVLKSLEGDAIPDDLFPTMFRLYRSTIDKLYWGRQYLNERLFALLAERWRHRLCFVVARRGGARSSPER